MKPLVIYHSDCTDGFAAAWAFWHTYRKDMEYHPGIYGEVPPDVKGRIVYLVDFCYPPEVIEEMLKSAEKIYVIDHHERALMNIESITHSCLDRTGSSVGHSGAVLAWLFVNRLTNTRRPIPPALGYIEDRDLWHHVLPDTKEINMAIYSTPFSFAAFDTMVLRTSLKMLKNKGKIILQRYDSDVATIVRMNTRRLYIAGFEVPVANASYQFASDVANILGKGERFAATYYDTATHRVFSLRSEKNKELSLDVSKIAQDLYGGGGHRHAAGFKVVRSHPLAKA